MKTYGNLNKREDLLIRKALKYYSFINKKAEIKKNVVACVNNVYLIMDGKHKFILRLSQKGKELSHLKLEIEFLQYLHKKRFKLAPYVIPNKNGELITLLNKRYYILLNFMPGETKASWNNLKHFNKKKLVSFFKASAYFTKATKHFKPRIKFENKQVYYYIKDGQSLFNEKLEKISNARIKKLLSKNREFIYKFILQNKQELDELRYDQLPKQLVHFDLHPGNVNFIDDKVSGIFDFDWIRFDNRISDLAGTISMSCYQYGGKNNALYDKKKIWLGLKTYRKAFGKSEFDRERENKMVKIVLKSYLFFQFLWCTDLALNSQDQKSYEYLNFFIKVLKLNDYDWLFNMSKTK